jgi:hypothetical protein
LRRRRLTRLGRRRAVIHRCGRLRHEGRLSYRRRCLAVGRRLVATLCWSLTERWHRRRLRLGRSIRPSLLCLRWSIWSALGWRLRSIEAVCSRLRSTVWIAWCRRLNGSWGKGRRLSSWCIERSERSRLGRSSCRESLLLRLRLRFLANQGQKPILDKVALGLGASKVRRNLRSIASGQVD